MTEPGQPGPRVLLVEDEPANRALVRAILARASDPRLQGLELLEARSIGEARTILSAGRVDAVLLDVRLPDGSGLDLAAEINAAARPRPRIVIISASVLPAERSRADESGADAFLAKPFGAAELTGLLAGLVGTGGEPPVA